MYTYIYMYMYTYMYTYMYITVHVVNIKPHTDTPYCTYTRAYQT